MDIRTRAMPDVAASEPADALGRFALGEAAVKSLPRFRHVTQQLTGLKALAVFSCQSPAPGNKCRRTHRIDHG